jgi:phosphotriesterase-related protein
VKVQTVLGPVDPDQLGTTLPHEHLLVDITRPYWTPADRDRLGSDFYFEDEQVVLEDESIAIEELRYYKEAGGSALVEVTPVCLHRNPPGLGRIAEATGVHIVMGCGFYFERHHSPRIRSTPTNELAAELERELTVGVGDTGIRAGIIGEIASSREFISPAEERVFRAAARAHRRTGAAITTHAVHGRIGLAQLDLLAEEGADLRRVAIGHSDTHRHLDYYEAIVQRGAFVQFDLINSLTTPTQPVLVSLIRALIAGGYLHQILLSQDICLRNHLHTYGGGGYDYLLTRFIPMLKAVGVRDEQVTTMLVENPRRLLAF